jgi:hypothetical protein
VITTLHLEVLIICDTNTLHQEVLVIKGLEDKKNVMIVVDTALHSEVVKRMTREIETPMTILGARLFHR